MTIADTITLPCGLTLSNRLAKAAMTERLAAGDGRSTSQMATLYRRMAQGGAGMMITGNILIDRRFLESPGNVVAETHDDLDHLQRLARSAGSVPLIAQLNHAGRQTPKMVHPAALAPSAVQLQPASYFTRPAAMRGTEVRDVIARFATAAALLNEAGFAGVQIHAAHGYLINQFLSPLTNQRDDEWGGSLENRARVLIETVRAIRHTVPSGFAVGVKLNVGDFVTGGFDPEDAVRVAAMLDREAVDFIELSGGTHQRPVSFGFGDDPDTKEAYFIHYTTNIRAAFRGPLMLTGGVRSTALMNRLITEGTCDLFGLARPMAWNPDTPKLLLSGALKEATSAYRPSKHRLESILELCWHRDQLWRIARGKRPTRRLSRWLAFLRMIRTDRAYARRSDAGQLLPASSS